MTNKKVSRDRELVEDDRGIVLSASEIAVEADFISGSNARVGGFYPC